VAQLFLSFSHQDVAVPSTLWPSSTHHTCIHHTGLDFPLNPFNSSISLTPTESQPSDSNHLSKSNQSGPYISHHNQNIQLDSITLSPQPHALVSPTLPPITPHTTQSPNTYPTTSSQPSTLLSNPSTPCGKPNLEDKVLIERTSNDNKGKREIKSPTWMKGFCRY